MKGSKMSEVDPERGCYYSNYEYCVDGGAKNLAWHRVANTSSCLRMVAC